MVHRYTGSIAVCSFLERDISFDQNKDFNWICSNKDGAELFSIIVTISHMCSFATSDSWHMLPQRRPQSCLEKQRAVS